MLRKITRGAAFFGLTLGYGLGVYAAVTRARGSRAKVAARDSMSGAWARALLSSFGIEVVVAGDAGGGSPGGRIVVANHRSIIDIAILLSLFGGAFVSRADLAEWPIVGPAARAAGTIFVDRGNKKSGSQAVEAMVARLATGDTVCVFPEGTTFEDDTVRPFKPGATGSAARAKAPVVPVALVYPLGSGAAFGGESFLQHLGRLADTKATRVFVEIGAPMWAEEGEALEAFTERSRAEVTRLSAVGRAR